MAERSSGRERGRGDSAKSLSGTADRVTRREGGRRQVDRAQVGDVLARFGDELLAMPVDEAFYTVARLIARARRRAKR